MSNKKQRTLLIFAVALIGFAGALESGEPQFKQYPADLSQFSSYFVSMPMPNYPDTAAAWHKKGSGWFRLAIDPATGVVTEVKVLKSTGVKILDDSIAVAFLRWRAKPHRIDHAILQAGFGGPPPEQTGSHIKR
jgi:TonB family protein